VGNHKIILGDCSDLEQKFKKLFAFYKDGLNKIGWNTYKTINLKYKNQVVCTRI
jgi:cell division protein FtsQ